MSDLSPKKFSVLDPIFHQRIYVFLNCKEEEYLRWQKRLNVSNGHGLDPNLVAFSTHVSAENEPNKYIVWLNHFNWTLDDQESLIHEIIHTIVRIWEANNISFVPETQEFYAHSVGRLYSVIAAKLMAEKKK